MQVRKMALGVALTAMALLSACSQGTDTGAQPGLSVPVETSSSSARTATSAPTTAPAPSSSGSSATSTTKPKATTTTPPKPKTTTPKPTPEQSTEAPCSTAAKACIKLSTNQSWLMDNGKVVYGPVKITHGKAGYRTPPGSFRVGWKDIDHKSSEFNNAPMNFSVFFNGGIAFHEGSLSQTSHGCIHLSRAVAQKYYNSLAVGAVVEVVK